MNHPAPLDVDWIEAARKNACIGRKVVLFQSTGSTNDIAWEYANNPDNHGLCVLAEKQTAGRGRRGRAWYSEPYQSILCSIVLTQNPIEAELLTLTAAVAATEAINEAAWISCKPNHGQAQLDRATRLHCRIKWPNDILIQEQKIAGILVEKRMIKRKPCFIVGIGINCNQSRDTFAQYSLNLPATSLAIETGQTIDRTKLVCELFEQLEEWLNKANRPSSIAHHQSPIITRWLQLSGMLGQHITVECDGRKYSGFCRGIDPAQGLIIQLDNSLVRMFSAAHTSLIQT